MMEIERKWLVDTAKCPIYHENYVILAEDVWRTVQGYLNTIKDEWLIRVRSINDERFFLELKTQGLLAREELSFKIHKDEFNQTLEKCVSKVEKTRYCYYTDNVKYEIDIFLDHSFVTCEVEFGNEETAHAFVAPDWCTKDVTYDPAYKNVNLAK